MDKALFSELLESTREALEHAKGKRDLRTTVLPAPPKPMNARQVRKLRSRLNASQAVFASYLNVSTKLVQAWESDRRTPDGAALRLMRLAEKAPELLLASGAEALSTREPTTRSSTAPAKRRSA
jgi:putative transcriptional regulator